MTERKLGGRLRALRIERGLSVRTLAARSGFSPSFISQVESDTVSPSIASLEKIAVQLGVTLGQLFSSIEVEPRLIVRRAERSSHHSQWSRAMVEVVADSAAGRQLSAVLVTFEAEGSSGGKPAPSLQDTFAMVLGGRLELTTEAGTDELAAGDAVYLQEGDPYHWRNGTSEPATLLLVSRAGRLDAFSGLIADGDDAEPEGGTTPRGS